jgi:hypothetical protein
VEHRLSAPSFNTAADGRGFRVTCSCGWRSQWCSNSTHAVASGEQHLQLMDSEARNQSEQAAEA